jgi:hypothetical protein
MARVPWWRWLRLAILIREAKLVALNERLVPERNP